MSSLTSSDQVIHKSKDLSITLETWRGQGIKVFSFNAANGLMLRVRFEDGAFSVIFNRGNVEVPNNEAHPVVLSLSKR